MNQKEREMIEKAYELQKTRADEFIKLYSKMVCELKAMLSEYEDGLEYWKNVEKEIKENGKGKN